MTLLLAGCRNYTWAKPLAQSLDTDLVDISIDGGSCNEISQSVMSWIQENLREPYSGNTLYILILWPSPIIWGYPSNTGWNRVNGLDGIPRKGSTMNQRAIADLYVDEFFDIRQAIGEMLLRMVLVNSFLANANLKYMMMMDTGDIRDYIAQLNRNPQGESWRGLEKSLSDETFWGLQDNQPTYGAYDKSDANWVQEMEQLARKTYVTL